MEPYDICWEALTAEPKASPPPPPAEPLWQRVVYMVGALVAATPWVPAPLALTGGMVLALMHLTAWPKQSKTVSKYLIQVCVVALGLRIDLHKLMQAATEGLALAVGTIVGTVALGLLLGKLLKTGREPSVLVTSGTAICGGSAIAAVGGAMGASRSSMSVATGAIFLLNAVGLYTLPLIAHKLGMTEVQFGQWAGVALHDVASVAGAASGYHDAATPTSTAALDTANIVKLTRVIWIFPLALFFGWQAARAAGKEGTGAKPTFPWFILWFLAASALRTFVPALGEAEGTIKQCAAAGFQMALFLIGSGLSAAALKQVGWRALVQAAVLWVVVATASAAAIMV